MENETPLMIQIGAPLITEERFTVQFFKEFLLDSILTEVFYCDLRIDRLHPTRKILTAFGKLQDQWYLMQLTSEDASFEDVRIIQLPMQWMGVSSCKY
jgi:hypothetical protein